MKYLNRLVTLGTLLCVAVAMLAMAAPASAAIMNPLNSSAFTYKYEGDTIPTTTGGYGNTGYGTGSVPNTIQNLDLSTDGNILTTTPTGQATKLVADTTNSGDTFDTLVDNSTGFTWETRMRQKAVVFTPSTLPALNRFEIGAGDNDDGDFLSVDANALAYPGSGGAIAIANNDGQFHTYRVAQAPNSTGVDFWFDDVHKGTLPGHPAFKFHRWGHLQGWTTSFEIDYVRWEVGGYSPAVVPEPATASLLLLGAVVALRWWRRR
ncbi:MAG: PEP-CTERM sorting domain-containing protein [Pirellulales bacterium]